MRFRTFRILLNLAVIVSMLLPSAATAPTQAATPSDRISRPGLPDSGLYRTSVSVLTPARWQRLEQLGVTILERGEDSALVLVDGPQLEDLARLRFKPKATDELHALVNEPSQNKAWLATSLQPLFRQAAMTIARLQTQSMDEAEAVEGLRLAMNSMTPEQLAGITAMSSIDDDADGLTNTEESWWCTDPLNPNSDGDDDGYTDGQEVDALLDVTQPRNVRWGYGPPFGPPAAWPDFNGDDGDPNTPACNDGDWDTIPDYAEAYIVGSRVPAESTDGDKFDDGQELFGITYCPGGDLNCGHGSYPRPEYWNFIKATMPNWVLPPGDSPFVAAFPVPEVYVEPVSWRVERVTTITTSEGEIVEISNTYETAVTRGQSTSIADTVTWNEWEEVSEAVETPLGSQVSSQSRLAPQEIQACKPAGSLKCRGWGGAQIVGGLGIAVGGALAGGVICTGGITCPAGIALGAAGGAFGGALAGEGWSDLTAPADDVQPQSTYSITNINNNELSASAEANASIVLNQNFDFQSVTTALDGVQYAINRQGELLSRGLYDISYQISRPRYTETHTNGKSWGGSQTITHAEYEEHTISEGQAFTTGQNWETAWAIDSSHAADLTFNYSVRNTGTEYAREVSGLIFNIYLGDDTEPTISYPAWEQFPDGKLENLFPVGPNTPPGMGSEQIFASTDIPLSLEQMKRVDLGERLTINIENFSYGADELFYTDAVSGGVTVFIEDGVEDGDESVDMYVIPTWGVESVQDVLTRYFPDDEDVDGNINALWTPEFDGINPPVWNEHFLSDIAWWNVYLTQPDAGNTPLKDLQAQAGSGLLFRFNRDSDRDGYNDRAEFRYYCALPDTNPDHVHCIDGHLKPEIHPQPEVLAGYVTEREGDVVTVLLVVENTGTFDAYGIDAVMYSPDDTTTIGNNTVGGNGRVRPGNHVAVGSIIKPPALDEWGNSSSKPYAGGNYTGDVDRTYTITAETPGVVGQSGTSVSWEDGDGGTGVIDLGDSYHAPLPTDVAQGVQLGFNTGTIDAGADFSVEALTPRDTFTYTVESDPFTPPVIVVSHSDPQGSHRFITPIELADLDSSLAPHTGEMLEGLRLDVVATAELDAANPNTTNLVVMNPHAETIVNGHLYLNFVSDGTLVLEQSNTLDIPTGPTVFPAEWSVSDFSGDYNPDGDNILIAFWTDSEDNIIDSAARPFSTFAEDPRPIFDMDAGDELWDFSTAQQGTLMQRTFELASIGYMDLLTHIGDAEGITVEEPTLDSLPPGDMGIYTVSINTQDLPADPFPQTIEVRTSDPANPTKTITIQGEITPMPEDAPGGAIIRPLDWTANIEGDHNQGEWVEYTHTLGPEPQTLHPVKVYSQDYSTPHGVGRYAEQFLEAGSIAPWRGSTLLYDDFNILVPERWDFIHGTWHVADGVLDGCCGIPGVDAWAYTGESFWTDYSLKARVNMISGNGIVVFRSTGIHRTNDYMLWLWKADSPSYANRLTLERHTNGNVVNLSEQILPAIPQNVDVQVDVFGDHIQVYLNGVKWIDLHDPQGHATGKTGLGVVWDWQAQFDWFEVVALRGYIAEQVEEDPYTTTRLTLPESFTEGRTYQIQYGRRFAFDGDDEQTNYLRLNRQMVDSASMDVLVSNTGVTSGDLNLCLDFGNDGVCDWIHNATTEFPATLEATGLAAALNDYLLSHDDAPWGDPVNVPVRVQIDRAAQVLLTNLALTKTRFLRLPAQPYDDVTLSIEFGEFGQDDGNLAFTVDVGANGTVDWSDAGDYAFPTIVTSENLAAAFNDYLSGLPGDSGEVDVPIRIVSSPSMSTALHDFTADPTDKADLSITAGDIGFGVAAAAQPVAIDTTEGENIPINVVLHNDGAGDSGPFTVSFFATPPDGFGEVYIGADFVENVPAGGTATAHLDWNTLGFTGDIPVRVVIDPFDRLVEILEDNNEATANIIILTRPDLLFPVPEQDDDPRIKFDDTEPVVGQAVQVEILLQNGGQTAAVASTLALSVEDPDGVVAIICEPTPVVPGESSITETCMWTPIMPGLHRLLAYTDRDNAIDEFDEGNNQTWLDVYVGFAGPILLDSGAGDVSDPAYDEASGYGYLTGTASTACGTEPEQSQRRDSSGKVDYRFDHLLPGHFYHLDVTLYECDGLGRQERILIDDENIIGEVIDLSSGEVQELSYLLDPALYADRSIKVTIEELSGYNAVVSNVELHDIDYRYADAGGEDELDYSAELGYGPLDGEKQDPPPWGTLPYQTRRIEFDDNDLRYQFDRLDPNLRYQIHLTFYQGAGGLVQQTIEIDDIGTGVDVELDGEQWLDDVVVDVPPGTYDLEGSIVVHIKRTNAAAGAYVNEIALEQLTLGVSAQEGVTQVIPLHVGLNWISFHVKPPVDPASECEGVTATSAFTTIYGDAVLDGVPAPLNSIVEAYSADGDKAGCFKVTTEGLYGYMKVYGAEGATPGMQDGDPVFFKINGISASSNPEPFIWHDDKLTHEVEIEAPDVIPAEYLLSPIDGQYDKLFCENGTYLPLPADPRYNTCKTVEPGLGYQLYANTVTELPITGPRVAADTPLTLHEGWNWIGYLPTCELEVETALASISGSFDLLHNEIGTYRPPPANPAFNNFNTMEPSYGYMIHVVEAVTLMYPADQCGLAQANQSASEQGLDEESCPAIPTSNFTQYYGYVFENDSPLAAGSQIIAYSPRGEAVGCVIVKEEGLYPYMRVYGAEGDLPGMLPDEPVTLTAAGRTLLPSAPVIWQGDYWTHRVDLMVATDIQYLPMIR